MFLHWTKYIISVKQNHYHRQQHVSLLLFSYVTMIHILITLLILSSHTGCSHRECFLITLSNDKHIGRVLLGTGEIHRALGTGTLRPTTNIWIFGWEIFAEKIISINFGARDQHGWTLDQFLMMQDVFLPSTVYTTWLEPYSARDPAQNTTHGQTRLGLGHNNHIY